MKTRVLSILSLIVVLSLAGCPNNDPTGQQPGPDTADDTDTHCVGDQCGAGDEGVIDTETRDQESDPPPACKDLCELGEIECATENSRYRECGVADDGCLDFVGASIFCPPTTECICGMDEPCAPEEGIACVCIPECGEDEDAKECGPDGCGNDCGTCPPEADPEATECNQDDGTCFIPPPDCEGCVEACGEDGSGPNCCLEDEQKCNGVKIIDCVDGFEDEDDCACWTWPEGDGEDCPDDHQICQEIPDELGVCTCEFLLCDNGCCSSPAFTTCNPLGECCTPECAEDQECGDDTCGGQCGECLVDEICDVGTGKCIIKCFTNCPAPGVTACKDDFSFETCVEVEVAGETCNVWDAVITYCEPQHICDNGACVCVPDCDGKNCGDDGCGGSCGDCGVPPNACNDDGVCECVCEAVFQPVCDTLNCETYDNWCEATCAGVVTIEQGPCDCGCTSACTEDEENFGPVCGIDEVTYESFCDLKCSDDEYDNGCLTIDSCDDLNFIGICEADGGYCMGTNCPVDFNPLCATDGTTYWNSCCFQKAMEEIAVEEQTDLDELMEEMYFCQGACVDEATCPDAPMICDPVCALSTEGAAISYINAQIRDCLEAYPLCSAPCCNGVSLEEDWVCAEMDGTLEAFQNADVLMCVDTGTPPLYAIPQDAFGDYQVSVCDDCQCDLSETDDTTWLCGEDFTTYLNQCALSCFADPPALPEAALCESGCGFMTFECPCPLGIGGSTDADTPSGFLDTGARGVCGDDGYTYGSICDAAYNGVVVSDDIWCEECENLCKGIEYEPLCCKLPGQDTGATYATPCIVQNCSTAYETGDCFAGECCFFDEDCDDGDEATNDTCNVATLSCDYF